MCTTRDVQGEPSRLQGEVGSGNQPWPPILVPCPSVCGVGFGRIGCGMSGLCWMCCAMPVTLGIQGSACKLYPVFSSICQPAFADDAGGPILIHCEPSPSPTHARQNRTPQEAGRGCIIRVLRSGRSIGFPPVQRGVGRGRERGGWGSWKCHSSMLTGCEDDPPSSEGLASLARGHSVARMMQL
jgi:hypothetical protein